MGIPYHPFQEASFSVSPAASRSRRDAAFAPAWGRSIAAPRTLINPPFEQRNPASLRNIRDSQSNLSASNLSTHVSVRLLGDGGDEQLFKMRRSARLVFLLDLYCQRRSARRAAVQLWFNGQPVDDDATPDDLRMGDCDSLRVVECD